MLNSIVSARYWRPMDDGRIECRLCPRFCHLKEGQRGLCFVRQNIDNELKLTTYGRSSGFCIDPIEKKPLNHFYPGTSVLSFGTAGCNLACKFCQNWDISKSREIDTLADAASPEQLALTCTQYGCHSIAYTYNDPVIFLEYACDVASACREAGVKNVAVTAGYICEAARPEFFRAMDAVNVDLKAFNRAFYKKLCGGSLDTVLETLEYIHRETSIWLEITTLIIPGENDSEAEIQQQCQWIAGHLGFDVPLHFSAFHPDWKMRRHPRTPKQSLLMARRIAQENGLHYVFTGNIHDPDSASTYCPECNECLIRRGGYELIGWNLDDQGRCRHCRAVISGVFENPPGNWGNQRLPVRMTRI